MLHEMLDITTGIILEEAAGISYVQVCTTQVNFAHSNSCDMH